MQLYLLFLGLSISATLFAPAPVSSQPPAQAIHSQPYRGVLIPVTEKSCEDQLRELIMLHVILKERFEEKSSELEHLTIEHLALIDESVMHKANYTNLKEQIFNLLGSMRKESSNIQNMSPSQFISFMQQQVKALLSSMNIEQEEPKNTLQLISRTWNWLQERCAKLEDELSDESEVPLLEPVEPE